MMIYNEIHGDDCRKCMHSSAEKTSYAELHGKCLMYCEKFKTCMTWKYGRCSEFEEQFSTKYGLK